MLGADERTKASWGEGPGDIKQTLIDVTKKIQEIRERYDHYTHIHMTSAAWKFVTCSGGLYRELDAGSTLYGLPFKLFPTLVDLVAHKSSPQDKILAVDYVDGKLIQLNLEAIRSLKSSYMKTATPIELQ